MRGVGPAGWVEDSRLRDREGVFEARDDAGAVLARLLEEWRGSSALVLGVPAGGVPVGVAVAEHLGLPLDVAVVSKITLPWNSEVGYGAVAFDGTVRLNQDLLGRLRLEGEEIRAGVERTRQKVDRRVRRFRGDAPWPDLSARPAVLVDDGLASGFTMRVAVEAVVGLGCACVLVGVPTGHVEAVRSLSQLAHRVYCANVRTRYPFAVASAYRRWRDVSDGEVSEALRGPGAA